MSIPLPTLRRALCDPAFYPHSTKGVCLRETHISLVALTGRYVYKFKKPLDLGFLDFSTLTARCKACRDEVALNRRLSEGVYLDVAAVTRQGETLRIGGKGPAVEYAVRMRQLPQERTMDRLLADGRLTATHRKALAAVLHRFYSVAAAGPQIDHWGGVDVIGNNCRENFEQTRPFVGEAIERRAFDSVRAATLAFLDRGGNVLDRRRRAGKIRDCHGDLRSEHVYFTDKGIQIIDCIEFNERFRFGDVAGDLAFLLMDLDLMGHRRWGRAFLKAYVRCSGDLDLYNVLAFYKCYRAMVRVKVGCLRQAQRAAAGASDKNLETTVRRYMRLAYRYALAFSRPAVWVVCGPIAAGKSTMARALSEVLAVSVLSTDEMRRKLFAHTPTPAAPTAFETGAYSSQATARTYGRLLEAAAAHLSAGRSVIVDATFSRAAWRREVGRLAAKHRASIFFVSCTCDETIARERLRAREGGGGPSDARLSHWEAFKERFEPPTEVLPTLIQTLQTHRPVRENLLRVLNRFAYG